MTQAPGSFLWSLPVRPWSSCNTIHHGFVWTLFLSIQQYFTLLENWNVVLYCQPAILGKRGDCSGADHQQRSWTRNCLQNVFTPKIRKSLSHQLTDKDGINVTAQIQKTQAVARGRHCTIKALSVLHAARHCLSLVSFGFGFPSLSPSSGAATTWPCW